MQEAIDEGPGEGEFDLRANAKSCGQFELEPTRHSEALNHDRFWNERRSAGLAKQFREGVGKAVEAIAGMEMETHRWPRNGASSPGGGEAGNASGCEFAFSGPAVAGLIPSASACSG